MYGKQGASPRITNLNTRWQYLHVPAALSPVPHEQDDTEWPHAGLHAVKKIERIPYLVV
jgi:hypothetical protein